MQQKTKDDVTLDCRHSGKRKTLTLEEAHRLFWECTFAWLLPTDLYRWEIQEYADLKYVYEHVRPADRRFALHLHTRGTRALTQNDLEELESKRIDIRAFRQRAARFHKIFGDLPLKLRPFFDYQLDLPGQLPKPAYRMHPGRPWLVVVGVAAGSEVGEEEVDWSLFLNPPRMSACARASIAT